MTDQLDPLAEIKASFFIECDELLEALQDGLETMDSPERSAETINVVFRAVHSLKGGAGAFGLNDLVNFAHCYESVLDNVRSGLLEPNTEIMRTFFQAGDILQDLVRLSRDELPIEPSLTAATLTDLEALLSDEVEETVEFAPLVLSFDLDEDFGLDDAAPKPAQHSFTFQASAELYASGNEPAKLFRALTELGTVTCTPDLTKLPNLSELANAECFIPWHISVDTDRTFEDVLEVFDFVDGLCTIEQIAPQTDALLPPIDLPDVANIAEPIAPAPGHIEEATDVKPAEQLSTEPDSKKVAAPKATVRVDVDRIDRLVNLVGELVINQSMLSQSIVSAQAANSTELETGLEEFMRLTRDIQDSVMMIRAQPVKSLFQRMSRIVRESSAAVKKSVKLITEGDDTEVDKTVIERLADPLTHMIRNAVDHGLEAAETRVANGKAEQGVVRLRAAHRSGRVVIEVSDDGRGINRDRVKQIAIDKGLIPENVLLSDTEIDNLLFMPGFSTAAEVSNLSGRGVGMDVVRSAIQSLGGRITITSVPGQGTTFSISLPLTLAVLDGMVIDVAGQSVVMPLAAISETMMLGPDELKPLGANSMLVQVRERFLPLIDLAEKLGFSPKRTDFKNCIALLIANDDGQEAAIVIDAIQDQRQVVIKGLQDAYGNIPGVAAATILGDGKIALILDPGDIVVRGIDHTDTAQPQSA